MPALPFADFLRSAREKAGLTQAALAEACALTGSYISLLESGKKPAPSDRVVRKLAASLALPEAEALRVAHLDRAPEELRRSVERLTRQAALEREMRERTVEALFPFSLWNLLPTIPGRRALHPRPPSLAAGVLEVFDRFMEAARSAPDLPTFQARSRELLAALPEEERRRVLEAAPAVIQAAGGEAAPGPAAAPAQRVLPAPAGGFPPEVLPGDTLVLEVGSAPAEGDLVFRTADGGSSLTRFARGMDGILGVVVQVRRSIKRG